MTNFCLMSPQRKNSPWKSDPKVLVSLCGHFHAFLSKLDFQHTRPFIWRLSCFQDKWGLVAFQRSLLAVWPCLDHWSIRWVCRQIQANTEEIQVWKSQKSSRKCRFGQSILASSALTCKFSLLLDSWQYSAWNSSFQAFVFSFECGAPEPCPVFQTKKKHSIL